MNKKVVILALLLVSSLTACGKSNSTPSPSSSSSAAPTATSSGATTKVDAQAVFKANCVSCHGANLEGMVGPSLQKVGGKLTKEQIVTTITNGKGAMPSFKGTLSADDVNALSAWLADKK
ncbi:cytochrome c [Paenibacillus alba]|uniref:c-type cytochrome n=1 Tax=Paenibacillus alba TaxID=1197127 RepID=UPI001564218A|nr:cytochrome c [Paenibacillus alba]NQX66191.1 cytochrome c [Paenibacillus alba]